MSALPPADHRRLKSSLALLASPSDGEVLAAVAAVGRILGAAGLAYPDLANGLTELGSVGWNSKAARRAMYPERAGPPSAARLLRQHQREAGMLLQSPYPWDDWQSRFLQDLLNWHSPISDRQQEKLRECRRLAETSRGSRAA